jgi:uncharacterized delta-60 repeat protein
MNRMNTLRALAASTLALSLVACGGGGDASPVPTTGSPDSSGTPTPPPPPPPPPPAGFTIDVSLEKAVILQGDSVSVKATIHRDSGFAEAVQVALSGLPTGVSASPATIAAGADQADIVLSAQGSAPHSLPTTVSVKGHATSADASHDMTVTVRGPAGAVDTSFAGGIVRQAIDIGEDYANAVAVQGDGKVIVAGSSVTATGTWVSLMRLQRDGSLDTAFGSNGKVITHVGTSGNDAANAIALQDDGKIVVAGSSQGATGLDFAVLRYNADGSLDGSFGTDGKVRVDFAGDTDRAWSVLVQNDGKILVGGEANTGSSATGVDFALLRLNANGSLDAGFGSNGRVLTPIKASTGTDVVRALAIQPVLGEARIVAVGGEGDFLAARYKIDGTLDTSFGTQGKVVGLFNATIGGARALTLLPSGGFVIAGHINHHFAAVQLTSAGSLDASFGTAGRFEKSLVANWNEAQALVRQSDGKLILGGWVYAGAGSSGDFAALRLNADGSVDTGFGTAGVTITPAAPGTKSDQAKALLLQADERVPTVRAIEAGESNDSNNDFTVIRLWL